ncbi:hypothetical protein [Streptomyces caniscabiei]|uniref:hypothetical protein n=1 Tax=Streptomyces caniscabiei TaxID=2746961 RepID=UPI000765C909|nr:hypothetical protein [Streptomyces caniscabiei]
MTDSAHPNDRPHNNNTGRFEPSQPAAEKAARAAHLKAENPRLSYQQIADAVGYNNKSDAWRAIQRCRDAVIREAGAELVAAEAAHLDDLFVEALEVLQRDHVTVSHGRIVKDDDGRPILDDGPKLAAIDRLLRVRESYRKLYGADQPAKVEHSGGVKYEIVGVDVEALK